MTVAQMHLAQWRRTHGVVSGLVRNDEKEPEVKKEVEKIVEKKDAQEAANFEEVPAWAAGLMQTVKDMAHRIDEIEVKTKGGVPGVEDGEEGTERREHEPRSEGERTAVAKDALGEPAESAANGPEAGRKFAEAERAETRGEAQFAGQGLSPVTASKEEQERLQRSREAGPERSELDPRLEDGVDRFNTQGQRNDGRKDARREDYRGHGPDKVSHHSTDRMDAMYKQTAAQLKDLQALMAKTLRQPTIEERNEVANARKRADGVYASLGRTTPEWLPGEAPMAYRRRLADGLKDQCAALKKTVMDALPEDVFAVAEERVYADASDAAKQPAANPPMVLRPHTYQDATGHNVTEYFGDPLAWMSPFMSAGARSKIRRPARVAN